MRVLSWVVLILTVPFFLSAQDRDRVYEWNQKGVEAGQKGEWKEAIYYFSKAHDEDPRNKTILNNLKNAYLNQIYREITKNRYSRAQYYLSKLKEIIESDKDIRDAEATLYNNASVYYVSQEDYEKAFDYIEKAYRVNPENKNVRNNYLQIGLKYAQTLSKRAKEEILLKLANLFPRSTTVQTLLGDYYYENDELEKSLRHYGIALEVDPENDGVRLRYEKAKKDYEKEKNLRVKKRALFTIKYQGVEREDLAWKVLNILTEAYHLLRNRVGFYSRKPLTVILYTGDQFKSVSGAPDWSGGIYDGKIRIREGDILGDEKRLKDLLYHEYTHALIHERTKSRVPTWWNEGLAQYFEPSREWSPSLKEWLKERLDQGQWFSLEELSQPFVTIKDAQKALLAYRQSYALIIYLSKTYGDYSFIRVMNLMAAGDSFKEAFKKVYFVEDDILEENFKFFVRSGG